MCLYYNPSLHLLTLKAPTSLLTIFISSIWLNQKLKSIFSIFFKKIKFKGKGYRIYSSKNKRYSLTFMFGHSHFTLIPLIIFKINNLTKLKILLTFNNFNLTCKLLIAIFKIKPLNIFTNRGIRFAKQVVYKKTGKVSTYR